jgi:uncharacterized cupin superfamily protein
MRKIDLAAAGLHKGTAYPAPFNVPCLERARQKLGDAGGLTDFGVNLLTLQPGVWSSQRHWHRYQDEFVYVLSGEVTLVTDNGEEILRTGDCVAFPKNSKDGHHLINKSGVTALCLEIGTRTDTDFVDYPDIDLQILPGEGYGYSHKDGTPY